MMSTSEKIISLIREFLVAGGDLNQRNEARETLLHKTVEYHDNFDAVMELACAGADVNSKTIHGITPLHVAVIKGHRKAFDALIQIGVFVDIRDVYGNTALHYAINSCKSLTLSWDCSNPNCFQRVPDIHIIEKLLQHESIDVNARNINGYTPLIGAVKDGNVEIVRALLKNGADVNFCNNFYETPLHITLSYLKPNMDIAVDLLLYGANIYHLDGMGQTPLDRAFNRVWDDESLMFAENFIKIVSFTLSVDYNDLIMTSLKGNSRLLHFYMQCSEEMERMRSQIISEGISLYDFVLHRTRERNTLPPELELIKTIVQILVFGGYDIYFENILKSLSKHELYKVLGEPCENSQYENMSLLDIYYRICEKCT